MNIYVMLNHGLVKTVNWFIFGSVISNKNTKLVNHEYICDTIKMSDIFVQVWINKKYSKYSIAMKQRMWCKLIIFKNKNPCIPAYV